MNKIILAFFLFLICGVSYSGSFNLKFLPDTIIIKTGSPDSVITEQGSFVNGTDTTSECDIYLSSRSLLKNVRMVSITDSSLVIMKDSVRRVINIGDVKKIVFFAGTGFFKGAAIGMGVSIAVFTSIGAFVGYPGYGFIVGLITGLPAALFIGLIGAFAEQPDVYYFSRMNTANKIKRIGYIMSIHK